MPRCTVGTAGPPEEPPLCAEEAMCGAERAARETAGLARDVSVGVRVVERLPSREAGELQAAEAAPTDWLISHWSSSGTGSKRGDAISAAATRSIRRASVPERHRPPTNYRPTPAGP